MTPFVVLSLPRSRTAWLSRFLTYGDWVCGHDELRHVRSLSDVEAWFAQPAIGTCETAGAPWWRLLDRFAPGARVIVIRRPVAEVVDSLMKIGPFDRAVLETLMTRLDRKLDQIEARLPCLSIRFDELDEEGCAKVFEYALGLPFDRLHWAALAPVNIQINMPALMRYCAAYGPAMHKVAAVAKQQTLAAMQARDPIAPDGITFQVEDCDAWERDARHLFEEHCVRVGEDPNEWQRKNWPLFRAIESVGGMQIMTARSNGRMFGYLMTLISPSLVENGRLSASHTTFYADPSFPGLGLKLQRAALTALKARGVDEVYFEAGQRGDGPRLDVLYRRLGAAEHGRSFRLDLKEAA